MNTEFNISTSLDLPADAFGLSRSSLDWFQNPPSNVTLKVGYDDKEITQIGAGVVDSATLTIGHDSVTSQLSGRDRVADLIDQQYTRMFFAEKPEEAPENLYGHRIPYAVGHFTAKALASRIITDCGLQLEWACPDWLYVHPDVRPSYSAFGTPLSLIQGIISPLNQTEMYKVDVWADGTTIHVKKRQGPNLVDAEFSYAHTDARISHIQVTKRRLKGVAYVAIEDVIDEERAGEREDCAKRVHTLNITSSSSASSSTGWTPTGGAQSSSQEVHTYALSETETIGGVTIWSQNYSFTSTLTTDKVNTTTSISTTQYIYDRPVGARDTDGNCLKGHKVWVQSTSNWAYNLSLPRTIGADPITQEWSYVTGGQRVTYRYDQKGTVASQAQTSLSNTTKYTDYTLVETSTQSSSNISEYRSLTNEMGQMSLKSVTADESGDVKLHASDVLVAGGAPSTHPVPSIRSGAEIAGKTVIAAGGGLSPSASGGGAYDMVAGATPKPIKITSMGLPAALSQKIAAEMLEQEGVWEYVLSFDYLTMPWLRKGMSFRLTGTVEDGAGNSMDLASTLPVFLITENAIRYSEGGENSMRGSIQAVGYKR